MASDYDATEFIDGDFQAQRMAPASAGATRSASRAPSREEVDSKVVETQQRLAELKRAHEELERERSSLEETRRRQMELGTGRQEMIQHLIRGIGLLEEAEFSARRDAEQMAKTLTDFRDALAKIQAIKEETWTTANFEVELTRALTHLENARMEWNSARLKLPVLSGANGPAETATPAASAPSANLFSGQSFASLCRVGLALTWPVAVVASIGLAVLLILLLRR